MSAAPLPPAWGGGSPNLVPQGYLKPCTGWRPQESLKWQVLWRAGWKEGFPEEVTQEGDGHTPGVYIDHLP